MLPALVATPLVATPAVASSYKILYTFPALNGFARYQPESLIRAPSGSFFGVMQDFTSGETAIFKLDPPATGQVAWTVETLHRFTYFPAQPNDPVGFAQPQILVDGNDNVYGGTSIGETTDSTRAPSLFRLSPPTIAGSAWNVTLLYQPNPATSPITTFVPYYRDSGGGLYGFALQYAASGFGNPFKLSPPVAPAAQSVLSILPSHDPGTTTPGLTEPISLLLGQDGAFYGAAYSATFRLTPPGPGRAGWTFDDVFVDPADVYFNPQIADRSLDLVSVECCDFSIYRLSPPAAGQTTWRKSLLYTPTSAADGEAPAGSLLNWHGILYGADRVGGQDGFGGVFRLTAPSPGSLAVPWIKQTLHAFAGYPTDGNPDSGNQGSAAPLVRYPQPDGSLALIGATKFGGANNNGIIYEVIP